MKGPLHGPRQEQRPGAGQILPRRAFLKTVCAAAGFAEVSGRPHGVPEVTLRDAARVAGIAYGAAASGAAILGDGSFAREFARQCAVLVPEDELKWRALRPRPGSFEFEQADAMVDWAVAGGLRVRGHTLVWHRALPSWFLTEVTPRNARRHLEDHVTAVVSRFAGRIRTWDVVNEVLSPADAMPDGMRASPWYRMLGPRYVDYAFRAAASADPRAQLVYNEAMLDYDTVGDRRRRADALNLLRGLRERDVPIHALGIQAHLRPGTPLAPDTIQRFCESVAGLGLRVMITELDVRDVRLPAYEPERDAAVAAAYEEYLDAVLSSGTIEAVTTWGLSDRYTWLAAHARRSDGRPVRVLPLDRQLAPKASYFALLRAFRRAPPRPFLW